MTVEIISPLPGAFYRKPSPDDPVFVEVGQKVSADTVIGLVEVMKQFNELTAGADGVITEFLIEDSGVVEAGQVVAIISTE